MGEFLKRHVHRVSKNEYADLIEQTRNVVKIIVEGGVKVGGMDEDMSEDSFESICLAEIQKIGESRKKWNFFESDFSSIAI